MGNPETLATLDTHDIGGGGDKQKKNTGTPPKTARIDPNTR